MDTKYRKQYKNYLNKCSNDKLLQDFYLNIQSKEAIKTQILKLLTINISGDHSTFTQDIRDGIADITKKIHRKWDLNPLQQFDNTHEIYLLLKEELTARRPELVKVMTAGEIGNKQEIKILDVVSKTAQRPETCTYESTMLLRKLDISERAINWLKNYDITTLWELFDRRRNDHCKNFAGMRNLWKKTYSELRDFLNAIGLINE